jgi:hypothetical protein
VKYLLVAFALACSLLGDVAFIHQTAGHGYVAQIFSMWSDQ